MSTQPKSPERIAAEIVDQFSWGSNVMHQGRLVGQQHVVALAIAEAIRAERQLLRVANSACSDAFSALHGVSTGRLKPGGRVVRRVRQTALDAFEATFERRQ